MNLFPQPLSRRDWLRGAGLGFGLLPLTDLLAREAPNPLAARPPHFAAKAKAVIYLFMHGGPSQMDSFDPKPALDRYDGQSAPESFHGLQLQFTDVKKQKLLASQQIFRPRGRSGIVMCDALQRLADVADELCVLRGCHHDIFNHTPGIWLMNTGHDRIGRPSLGSWVNYGLGSLSDNLPSFVVMTDGPLKPGAGVWGNGFLPAVYQGSRFDSGSTPIPNLAPATELGATDQRAVVDYVQSLNRQHAEKRGDDSDLEARVASYELAFRMQAAAPEAVDLTREMQATRDRYGGGFGEQCLIARRLVERGVRFVQIYHGCGPTGWDTHTDNHNGQMKMLRSFDQGAAALISDLKMRGLLEETLVVWGGEFGRTPTTEGNKGRDHNPYGFSMFLAGGGVKAGHVHGATDEFGFQAVQGKVHVHDLNATLLHLLGLDHEKLTYRYLGRDFRLTDVYGNVVREILA
jgi:uncharacterized protein (DUF1501 family)